MFAQFRAQYPQGSIKTEMLAKVDGLHVFRATVEHGGVVLSTATAADTDIEVTEDRAVKRALTIAGISFDDNYGIKATLMPQQVNHLSGINNMTNTLPRRNAEALPSSTQATMNFNEQLDLVELDSRDRDYETAPTYYDEPEYELEIPTAPTPVPAKPTLATESLISESFASPVDLSDPIAQIDVEMERLNWDRNMGRDYLQKVFRKRSRQQLTDSELMQFLSYLKSLPTSANL